MAQIIRVQKILGPAVFFDGIEAGKIDKAECGEQVAPFPIIIDGKLFRFEFLPKLFEAEVFEAQADAP